MEFFQGYNFDTYNIKEFLAEYLNFIVNGKVSEILCTEV